MSGSETAFANRGVVPALVADALADATREVFGKMVRCSVEMQPCVFAGPQPAANVASTVGFAAPIGSGFVSLCTSYAAALDIAEVLLDESRTEARMQMGDAAGEMANMIAGGFRARMAVHGELWAMTIPFVTIGTDFSVAHASGAAQIVCPFTMGAHTLYVHLVLQTA